jgi:hypothetical protein
LLRGGNLTTEQKQAAREHDQQIIESFLHACPRTKYAAISGKQLKTLNENHSLYGLPVAAGEDIDIVEVIQWFHDYLSTWGSKIKKHQLMDEESQAAEREREKLELRRISAQINKIENDVERRQAETISIAEVRKVLSWLAGELRKLGERLGKRFGPEAQIAMNESLIRIESSLADELTIK